MIIIILIMIMKIINDNEIINDNIINDNSNINDIINDINERKYNNNEIVMKMIMIM